MDQLLGKLPIEPLESFSVELFEKFLAELLHKFLARLLKKFQMAFKVILNGVLEEFLIKLQE